MIKMILAANSSENMILSFMTYITLIMSLVASIPVINCILKLRSEEKKNRLEAIYARSVSKTGQFLPYIIIAIILSVVLQLAMSFGMLPNYPIDEFQVIPVIAVTVTAVALLLIGVV